MEYPQKLTFFLYLGLGAFGYSIGYNNSTAWYAIMGGGGLMTVATVGFICHDIRMTLDKKNENVSLSILDREHVANLEAHRVKPEPAKTPGYLTLLHVDGKKYQPAPVPLMNTVETVRFDDERMVAKVLNDQRFGGFKMDISEAYWIRGGHWKGTTQTFRALRGKWEYYKIVEKKGTASNSPYEVKSASAIARIAAGSLHLPPPPLS